MLFEAEHSLSENEFILWNDKRINFPVHIHRSFEYFKQIQGSTEIWIEDQKYILKSGESVLVFPLQPHSYTCIEDGKIHIKCSPVQNITVHTGSRRSRSRWAYGDERLTEAKFGMTPEDAYVRFSITDKNGKSAHTHAYFWDEIFAE